MATRKRKDLSEAIEATINQAGSIGELERLAGIPRDDASRYEFWKPFTHLPGAQSLDAGCAELKHRIRTSASPDQS